MFTNSEGIKKLMPNAVPKPFLDSSSNDEPSPNMRECSDEAGSSEELVACRVCLAADGRLYAISGSGLEDTLAALTEAVLPAEDTFPRHLCVFCMAKLSKCAAFRDSCHRSTALLQTLLEKGPLKMNVIKAYNRKLRQQTNNLTRAKVFQFGTDSFTEITPVIKTETSERLDEEAKCAETEHIDSEIIKKDASDVNVCALELPIDKRERPRRNFKTRAKQIMEYIKVELGIDDNADSELDDSLEPEVNDSSDADSDTSEETLAAVKKRKRRKVTLVKENTAKQPKKHEILNTEDKHPTDVDTDTPEAATKLRKRVAIKSANTKSVIEKKNNRKTKPLSAEEQKEKVVKRKKNNKSVYSCDICEKEYKSESNLKMHKSRHDPNISKETFATMKSDAYLEFGKQYNFEIKLLTKEEQKQRIQERLKSRTTYGCDVCGKDHCKESTLIAHKTSYHNPSLPFECDVCFYRFRIRQELRKHQLEDRHRLILTCNECKHVTRNRTYAKEHFLMHRGKTFACPYCELKYDRQSSYYGHIRQQHPGENEACDQCGETFAGKVGLLVHKRMQHKNDKPNGEFKCKDCDVKFSSDEALQRHLELGAGVPHAALWPCAACGESCGSEEALKHHTAEQHSSEQRYCQKCNKTFSDAASFALHVERKHRNRRASHVRLRDRFARVVCELCGKVFTCLATLQYHMNAHLGLTPYQCQHCPKAFSHKAKLQLHMRIHTGEKPYKCEQCPQAFSARGNFTRHMKNVHLRVQVECDRCGKTMGAGSLAAHVRAVHMNQRQVRRKRDRASKTQARVAES